MKSATWRCGSGAAWYAAAPLFGLLLYWRAPFLWFVNDDFARLALPLEMEQRGLLHVLFAPVAQGTVRVIGERLFFLTFTQLFGLHALPFFAWILATWVVVLILIQGIGSKLTHSPVAGLAAALIWAANTNATPAVAWAAAYYQIAGALCLLTAFYSRLRWIESGKNGWRAGEWIAYLAGFGCIETMVMYPLVAALHAFCFEPKRLRSTAWLVPPALLYASVHFLLIPKSAASSYALAVDAGLPFVFAKYLRWMLEPASSALGSHAAALRIPEMILGAAIGGALAVFLVRRLVAGRRAALFFSGFFLLLLAPFLAIPRQVMPYYLTVPAIGLAWLAGWAISTSWHAGPRARAAAVALASVYFVVSAAGVNAQTRWFQIRGERMRTLMQAVASVVAAHPGNAVALKGVDANLFAAGFQEHPFRLVGATRVWLAPGTGFSIPADFQVSPDDLQAAVAQGRARVLEVSAGGPRDITARMASPAAGFVDVGNPLHAAHLGPSWYPAENGFRWAPERATVRISGPTARGQKLHVTGYAPSVLLAKGPPTLVFRAGAIEIGHAAIARPDEPFSLEFPLPEEILGRDSVEIVVEISRTYTPANDDRRLGMIFGTFRVQ